jgi:deoxyribonuclease V
MRKSQSAETASFPLQRAEKIQRHLSTKVIVYDCIPGKIKLVAGVDVAYSDGWSYGSVVVLEFPTMKMIEEATWSCRAIIPYVPTFLAFRELPAAVAAARKLETKPDVFLVDGHGRAHPRRFGLACHFGLALDAPTIGVAKNILCGEVKSSHDWWRPIIDRGEVIGAEASFISGTKPIYVSVGHKVSLMTAIKIVRDCVRGFKVPEPIRLAHISAERAKRDAMKY